MSSFRRLGSVTTKVGSGATPRGGKAVYTDDGVAFIRSQNVLDNAMKLEDVARITDEAAAQLRGVTVQHGDVLLNITGDSIARTCVVEPSVLPARVSQHVAIIRTSDELDGRFLQRYLVQSTTKDYLLAISDGGTRKALTKAHIENLMVPVPPIEVQRGIAEVLGALDAKIAANATCSANALALARAHFVQLQDQASEPVRVGDVLSLEYGKSLPASARRAGSALVYGSGGAVGTHDTALVDRPGVVVGRKGNAGSVHWAPGPHFPIDTTFFVVPKRADVPITYCYFALESLRLDEMNSDSAVPGLNRVAAHNESLRLPGANERMHFEEMASPLFRLADQTRRESDSLAEIRDALLPQLMSGKIRVKDAERVVEGAV